MRARHDLDTARVDDVIMGCANPLKEQGSVLSKLGTHGYRVVWADGTHQFAPTLALVFPQHSALNPEIAKLKTAGSCGKSRVRCCFLLTNTQ